MVIARLATAPNLAANLVLQCRLYLLVRGSLTYLQAFCCQRLAAACASPHSVLSALVGVCLIPNGSASIGEFIVSFRAFATAIEASAHSRSSLTVNLEHAVKGTVSEARASTRIELFICKKACFLSAIPRPLAFRLWGKVKHLAQQDRHNMQAPFGFVFVWMRAALGLLGVHGEVNGFKK